MQFGALALFGDLHTAGEICLSAVVTLSGAFALADHLAFTTAANADRILPMVVGKPVSAVAALLLAILASRFYRQQ